MAKSPYGNIALSFEPHWLGRAFGDTNVDCLQEEGLVNGGADSMGEVRGHRTAARTAKRSRRVPLMTCAVKQDVQRALNLNSRAWAR